MRTRNFKVRTCLLILVSSHSCRGCSSQHRGFSLSVFVPTSQTCVRRMLSKTTLVSVWSLVMSALACIPKMLGCGSSGRDLMYSIQLSYCKIKTKSLSHISLENIGLFQPHLYSVILFGEPLKTSIVVLSSKLHMFWPL